MGGLFSPRDLDIFVCFMRRHFMAASQETWVHSTGGGRGDGIVFRGGGVFLNLPRKRKMETGQRGRCGTGAATLFHFVGLNGDGRGFWLSIFGGRPPPRLERGVWAKLGHISKTNGGTFDNGFLRCLRFVGPRSQTGGGVPQGLNGDHFSPR